MATASEFWAGMNKFLNNGKIIVGPDYWKVIMTLCLITLPSIIFFASPAAFFIERDSNPVLLLIGFLLM